MPQKVVAFPVHRAAELIGLLQPTYPCSPVPAALRLADLLQRDVDLLREVAKHPTAVSGWKMRRALALTYKAGLLDERYL